MKKMKSTVLLIAAFWGIVCAGIFARPSAVGAAEFKPVAVISLTDADTFIKTAKDVTAKAGFPDVMASFEQFVGGIEVFNKTKPKGIVILSDGETFQGYAFAPVTDFTELPMASTLELENPSEGTYLLTLPNEWSVHFKQEKEWLFVSLTELPKTLPADPSVYLGGLEKKYLASVEINVENLPKQVCLSLLDVARVMIGMTMTDENIRVNFDSAIDQAEKALDQVKMIRYGFLIDPVTSDMVLEAYEEVFPDTEFAELLQQQSKRQTGSIGFFRPEDSLLAGILAFPIMEEQKEQLQSMTKLYFSQFREGHEGVGLDEKDSELLGQLIDNLENAVSGTIDAGKFDAGFSILNTSTVLGITTAAEGEKLADSLKRFVEEIVEKIPAEVGEHLKISVEKYKGYQLASFVFPLAECGFPELPDTSKNISLTLSFGTRNDSLCFAAGVNQNVTADLKKAIDASQTPVILPETVYVIAPAAITKIAKTWVPQLLEEGEYTDAVKAVKYILAVFEECPRDATITASHVYNGLTVTGKLTVSAKLYPVIAKLLKIVLESKSATVHEDVKMFELDEVEELEEIEKSGNGQ
ncbi:MAG: hypothetical protein LBQ54_13990 [Planctomycetaceae bacterium]|jgi:hypothetical protein|nr:hypothetical protein [Planctomycetaceae bacterium]